MSPGLAIGPPLVFDPHGLRLPPREIDPESISSEMQRLDRALLAARLEAEAAAQEARARIAPQYADILVVHSRMIADPTLRIDAMNLIESDRVAAEHAVREVLDGHAARLERLDDSFLASRGADIRDIQRRILAQLSGERPPGPMDELIEPSVALARDLTPNQTALLDPARVLGFATEAGGRASHTAIVAAALEIPAVVALGPFLEAAQATQTVIVDGDEGLVILDPDASTLSRYRIDAEARVARFAGLANLASLPAQTRDGTRVALHGNIEFPTEVDVCRERGADGVGLYRTEFLYLGADRAPTEEEQFQAYAGVARSMSGLPVTIRTLDIGADKLVSFGRISPVSRNPSLGLRSIRLSLRDPDLFRTQLRAILRASTLGDVRIMFPLVATLDELRQARAMLAAVAAELAEEGIVVRLDLPIGAMVEVPSAAIIADRLAKEVDFLSIGTNDLIQYALAVDRTDETVADLYNAADPAVLRLIAMVVAAAERQNVEVNVCGSMGGEPLYAMLLVGLGLRSLSMPPHQIPEVKRVIRAFSLDEARAVAARALELDSAEAVAAHLRAELLRIMPDAPVPPSDGHSRAT